MSPPEASAPPSTPLADAGEPPVVIADIKWAFWTHAGDLLAFSTFRVYPVAPLGCAARSSVAIEAAGIVAKNGLDRFVVRAGGTDDLWDAKSIAKVASLSHADRDTRVGAIDAAHIALTACKEHAPDANRLARCGELFDTTSGARTAGFVTSHDLARLDFSDNGKYLVGRGDSVGVTVFDAATGKVIVTRPHWKKLLVVHAWNRSDLAEISGDTLVVGYDEEIERIDLTTGKTLGKLFVAGKTMATFAPKSGRVAVMSGADNLVTVLDSRVVRKFDLRKHITRGADCTHCALEFDEADEDVVWLTSAYTDDRLQLFVTSGAVARAEEHALRSDSLPSATHHVQVGKDTCSLVSGPSARSVLIEFCDVTDGPWPTPGFSPDGRYLAALTKGALSVMPVDGEACVTAR